MATAVAVACCCIAAIGECGWQGAWLWSGKRNEPAAHRHFRKTFSADPATLRLAAFQCASDDWADIFLNGKKIGQSRSWARHLYLNGREEPLILYRGAINERGTVTYGRFMAGFDEACVRLAEVSLSLRQIWRPDGSIAETELEKYILSPLVYAPSYRLYIFLFCRTPTTAAAAQIARIRASGAACVDVNPGDKPKTPGEYRAMAKVSC